MIWCYGTWYVVLFILKPGGRHAVRERGHSVDSMDSVDAPLCVMGLIADF
jgi:hypothetical protein